MKDSRPDIEPTSIRSRSSKKEAVFEQDMLSGKVITKMIRFAIPLALTGLLQLFYTAADTVIIGRFGGDASLAAVGSNSSLLGLFTNLFLGMSVGSGLLVARLYGRGEFEKIHRTVHTSIALAITGGIFIGTAGFLFVDRILDLMSFTPTVLPLAKVYLRICFLGMPAQMVYNFGASMQRGLGDSKHSLYYLLFSGAVNVLLNILFVVIFRLDVRGVAFATVIAQMLSAILVIRSLRKTPGNLHFEWHSMRIHGEEFIKILNIGIPAGIQGILFSFADTFVQASVNSLGDIVMSGNAAATSVMSFPYVFITALDQTALTMMGQNAAAKQWKRTMHILISCAAFTVLLQGILCVLFLRVSHVLLGLYTQSEAVIGSGTIRMQIILPFYWVYALLSLSANTQRALRHNALPVAVTVGGIFGVRIMWLSTVFSRPEYHTIRTVYWVHPVSWFVTISLSLLCLIYVWRKETRSDDVSSSQDYS